MKDTAFTKPAKPTESKITERPAEAGIVIMTPKKFEMTSTLLWQAIGLTSRYGAGPPT